MQRIRKVGARRLIIRSGLVLAGVLVVAGALYGPAALKLYRFMESVEDASKENTARGGSWPRIQDACMPCHGNSGNPVSQHYARLAGQPQAYLVQQLNAFANGQRPNATMTPLALDLSTGEINRLSAFFAAQPVTANAPLAVDPARVKNGEERVKALNCAACHGPALQGQEANARLAGQGSEYLAKQLHDFKSGARRDPQGVMKAITSTMSDEDIDNLAHYLATLTAQAQN